MIPVTEEEAKEVVRNRDLFAKFGIGPEEAVLHVLGTYPVSKTVVDILLEGVKDVTKKVKVLTDRHGESKTYLLINAIIASGVYTPEELCAKYKKSILKKAANIVSHVSAQYGRNRFHAYDLLSYMGEPVARPVEMWDVSRFMYRGLVKHADEWFINVDDDISRELDVVRAATFARVLDRLGISAAEAFEREKLGHKEGDRIGLAKYLDNISYGFEINVNHVKYMAEKFGLELPSEYGPGLPIKYDVDVAVWLHERTGSPYYGKLDMLWAYRGNGVAEPSLVVPEGVDRDKYRSLLICQMNKWGKNSDFVPGDVAKLCNEFILNEERVEDVV